MSERVVFVTGGTRGIGLAIVTSLLAEGYAVVSVARGTTDEFEGLRKEADGALSLFEADLAQPGGQDATAIRIRSCRGLFGLVNNAGMAVAGLHAGLPRRSMARMWSLNVEAPMVLSQAAVKAMSRSRCGRIVNVSSVSSHKAFRGLAGYSSTKAALEQFSRVLALEVGPWGVTVNCVAPGFIETDMNADLSPELMARITRRNPLNRRLSAVDVAQAVRYLMSASADAITAQVIRVDSGAAL